MLQCSELLFSFTFILSVTFRLYNIFFCYIFQRIRLHSFKHFFLTSSVMFILWNIFAFYYELNRRHLFIATYFCFIFERNRFNFVLTLYNIFYIFHVYLRCLISNLVVHISYNISSRPLQLQLILIYSSII